MIQSTAASLGEGEKKWERLEGGVGRRRLGREWEGERKYGVRVRRRGLWRERNWERRVGSEEETMGGGAGREVETVKGQREKKDCGTDLG